MLSGFVELNPFVAWFEASLSFSIGKNMPINKAYNPVVAVRAIQIFRCFNIDSLAREWVKSSKTLSSYSKDSDVADKK